MHTLGEEFVASTGDGARIHGFGHWQVPEGGLAVRAYGTPLYFMKAYLQPVERNVRGRWYGLTEAGRAVRIATEPKLKGPNPYSDFGRRR